MAPPPRAPVGWALPTIAPVQFTDRCAPVGWALPTIDAASMCRIAPQVSSYPFGQITALPVRQCATASSASFTWSSE